MFAKFKIEYDPSYISYRYVIYRKDFKFLWLYTWYKVGSENSLQKAEAAVKELGTYPKYYEGNK